MTYQRVIAVFLVIIVPSACSPTETPELRSIRSHMAEMEGFSNSLFRGIDDPKYKDEVLLDLRNLKAGLRASMELVPESIWSEDLVKSQKEQFIIEYKKKAQVADDLIGKMITKVENDEFSEARKLLLELDQVSRECHADESFV